MHWSRKNPEKWKLHCEKMKGNKRGKGHKVSVSHKEKLIASNKNRVWTDVQKEQISNSVKEHYKHNPNPMQGKKHTKEAREKIVEGNLKNSNKGSNHYAFRGSAANCPRGIAWHRRRKEFIKEYSGEYGYICELCHTELEMGDVIDIHHLVLVETVIDTIQDINHNWNLMFLCHRCHIKIHNKLRGMSSEVSNWEYYLSRSRKAENKMKALIKKVQNDSQER